MAENAESDEIFFYQTKKKIYYTYKFISYSKEIIYRVKKKANMNFLSIKIFLKL